MTRQEAREELETYKDLRGKIANYRRRLEELQVIQETCRTSTYGHERKKARPYRQEELMDKATRVEKDYSKLLSQSTEFMHKIEMRVEKLKGWQYKIIYARYIEGKSIKTISKIIKKTNTEKEYYCIDHIKRTKAKGVRIYASLIDLE